MALFKKLILSGVMASAFALPSMAQTSSVAGGQSGYDETLEAISPTDEPVRVGLAGEDPADIGRYILAANGGVGGGSLSPDGETIAFSWSITGERQLWTIPATGGQPTRPPTHAAGDRNGSSSSEAFRQRQQSCRRRADSE